MRSDVFLLTYFPLFALWSAGAVAAWLTKTLTPGQLESINVHKGMGYWWHQGMWNDLISIHPFLSVMTALLWPVWIQIDPWLWLILIVTSLVAGRTAQRAWSSNTEVIESHTKIMTAPDGRPRSTGKKSIVGWLHVPHFAMIMTLGIAILVSSRFGYVPWRFFIAGILLFAGHFFAGKHCFLRHLDAPRNPWPKTEQDGRDSLLYICFTIAGYFFMLWQFVVKYSA